MTAARLSRQSRLPEVGEEGQARLVAATVHVPREGLAADLTARYLSGAGVGVQRDADDVGAPPGPPWAVSLHPAAAEVALGAWRALEAIRRALEAPSANASPAPER